MPKKDLDCVKNCNICSDIDLSDHFPMELTLKINTTDTNDKHIQQHREEWLEKHKHRLYETLLVNGFKCANVI